jgi:hypothetical protein
MNLDKYKDADKVDSWALFAVKWAVYNGIISGKGNDTEGYRLDPTGKATRIECAAMLNKFDEKFSDLLTAELEDLEEPLALPEESIEDLPVPDEEIEDIIDDEDIIDEEDEDIIDDEDKDVIDDEDEDIIDEEDEDVIDDEDKNKDVIDEDKDVIDEEDRDNTDEKDEEAIAD